MLKRGWRDYIGLTRAAFWLSGTLVMEEVTTSRFSNALPGHDLGTIQWRITLVSMFMIVHIW
jgi:hypothetical protein